LLLTSFQAFAVVGRPKSRARIVDDIGGWQESRPGDIVDAVEQDEQKCDGEKSKPEDKVIENGVV
jgi:hypothetical protein